MQAGTAGAWTPPYLHTLFSDVGLSSVTWEGPARKFVIVQSFLYASLTTSLFAAFLAIPGKQWVNRRLRNRGGSAFDKSRDRQRKLDGLEKWYFYIVIESPPVMLRSAVLLFGCALSVYLWTISRVVAEVIHGFTLAGIIVFAFFTLTATLRLPQPPLPDPTFPSSIIRALVRYPKRGDSTFTRPVRYRMSSPTGVYSLSVKAFGQIPD